MAARLRHMTCCVFVFVRMDERNRLFDAILHLQGVLLVEIQILVRQPDVRPRTVFQPHRRAVRPAVLHDGRISIAPFTAAQLVPGVSNPLGRTGVIGVQFHDVHLAA
jgi:hypothetical protein